MGRLTAGLFRVLLSGLGMLSISGQRMVARGMAAAVFWLNTDTARVTAANIAVCFPTRSAQAQRALVAESLAHSAMLVTELGTFHRWPADQWRRLAVAVDGEELLVRAMQEERGVLVLVPHFGNWEFLAFVLGHYGVTALYDPPRQPALEDLIRNARSRGGATMLPIDAHGLRRFYQVLAGGGLTALLPDQVPERRAGVHAEFFGRPALTMTFAQRLLRRTGARVLMGTAVRRPGGFAVRFFHPGDALADADPVVAARALNAAIEQLVLTDPAQYQWEYKRFKRPPAGTPDLYARS